MNTARTPAPELLALKNQLSLDTHVDPYEFADWVRANRDWMNFDWFHENGASNPKHPDHIHEIYASARMEYKRRVGVTASSVECIPLASVASRPTTSPSATQPQPAGSFGFSKLFRRRTV